MNIGSLLPISMVAFAAAVLADATRPVLSATAATAQAIVAQDDPRDCDGESCAAVARGFRAFFDRQLAGLAANGRACADCHMASDSFQLSPAGAEARFRLLQFQRQFNPDADDPLFRPIDADDFRTNGEDASDSAISERTVSSESPSRCRRMSG